MKPSEQIKIRAKELAKDGFLEEQANGYVGTIEEYVNHKYREYLFESFLEFVDKQIEDEKQ